METVPPPPFDPKAATDADWQAYNATMSKAQKRARAFKWVIGCAAVFALGFGARGEEKNVAAFRFAMKQHKRIFESFKDGKKRAEVLMWLAAEWVKGQDEGGSDVDR